MRPPIRLPGFLLLFCVTVTLTGTGRPAMGEAVALDTLVSRVQGTYEDIKDWEADFRHTTVFAGFDTPNVSTGHLFIKKPGKMRWDYREPTRDQIVVNDNTVWLYTPEIKQVVVSPFSAITDSRLPLHLLAGAGRLNRDFRIERGAPRADDPGSSEALRLIPEDADTEVSSLRLTIDTENFMITALVIRDKNGNQSRFEFSTIRKNSGLKDNLFVFETPAGVVTVESPLLSPD